MSLVDPISSRNHRRTMRPGVTAVMMANNTTKPKNVWLTDLLERSSRTAALKKVRPHVPRRLRVGQFQRRKLRATRPRDPRDESNSSEPRVRTTTNSAFRAAAERRIIFDESGRRRHQQQKQRNTTEKDKTNRGEQISTYNMETSSLGPKQLYLLNQFMGFDRFTGMEREDLVDLMVDRWMADPYVGDEYRQHVELYCESSFSIDRHTSEREFPNRLNTAVCCDMLQLIARKETKYRRALKLVKAGIFASIFSDYREAEDDGRTFLEMTPYYTKAKDSERTADELHRNMGSGSNSSSYNRHESRRRSGSSQKRGRYHGREKSRESTRSDTEEIKTKETKEEELLRCLKSATPTELADIIATHLGHDYQVRISARWNQLAGTQKMDFLHNEGIEAPPSKVVEESMKYTEKEMAIAVDHLLPRSESHSQRVLIHAIAANPEQNHSLKDVNILDCSGKDETKLPLLDLPSTVRRRTVDDAPPKGSFMKDSVSHASKVLIHAIASEDTDFMKELEAPSEERNQIMLSTCTGDGDIHVSDDTKLLTTAKVHVKERTETEQMIDESVGHAQKVLIHALNS